MRIFRNALALALILGTLTYFTSAITESNDEIQMRDASATKDRPRIEAYDMDEETV